MLEKRKDIDAVMIATPSHARAHHSGRVARGQACLCREANGPLDRRGAGHDARGEGDGLVTQMGNNGHAGEGLRQTREWIQAGLSAR